ncbi:MAG: hypothetical protein IIW17_00670, partial [Clostridia bacterium]|nr:hypothetical protein [Clostridia bacterium]
CAGWLFCCPNEFNRTHFKLRVKFYNNNRNMQLDISHSEIRVQIPVGGAKIAALLVQGGYFAAPTSSIGPISSCGMSSVEEVALHLKIILEIERPL